jgi:hypothetical protein
MDCPLNLRKQSNKEWYGEGCAKVNEKNNAASERSPPTFEPQVAIYRAKNGELLTNKNQVLVRWKEHFEEHLNEGSENVQSI